MPTYVCSSHLFSGLCSKLPSKFSLKRKKIGQHVAAGTLEAFCKFCIFPKPRPQSRMHCKVHFRQGLHVCPEESWKWKKDSFSHIIKTNTILWSKFLGGNKAGGWSGRGRRKGGRRHDACGHVVTCTFPFQLRSPGHPVKSFNISTLQFLLSFT